MTSHVRRGWSHEALIYDADQQLQDRTSAFAARARQTMIPLMLAVSAPTRKLITDAIGPGNRTAVLDERPDEQPVDRLRRLARLCENASSDAPLYAISDRSARGDSRWDLYEAWLEELFADRPLNMLCLYDQRTTRPDRLHAARLTHSRLHDHGTLDPCNAARIDTQAFIAARESALARQLRQTPPRILLNDPTADQTHDVVAAICLEAPVTRDQLDALPLAARAAVQNAQRYGAPPITVEIWAAAQITVLITDHGRGLADPFTGLLAGSQRDQRSLELIYDAVDDVALWRENAVTTIKLSSHG